MGLRSMVSPTEDQPPAFPTIRHGQGSLYKLTTFDEFHNHLSDLRKPLNAMNLDELVNTVIAVDQQIHDPDSSSSSSSSNIVPRFPTDNNMNGGCKTINDMLHDIVPQGKEDSGEKLATCGQIALEGLFAHARSSDFGAQASGRIERDTQPLLTVDPLVQQQAEWLQYHNQQQHMELMGSGLQVFGNSIVNAGYGENHQISMPGVSMGMVMPTSTDSQTVIETKPSVENVDKSIERRQKRMIKNRESAARSRAKKQAYINKLEKQVEDLESENLRLKMQKEEMKSPYETNLNTRFQLRRTSSGPL